MAVSFDIRSKFLQSQRQFEAATLLLREEFYNEATVMYWLAVRDCLFGWLEARQIPFDSTQAALVAAVSYPALKEVRADLFFAYAVGTMAEWDEGFFVARGQANEYKSMCEKLTLLLKI